MTGLRSSTFMSLLANGEYQKPPTEKQLAKWKRRVAGFTRMELLVALAVLALVIGMILPARRPPAYGLRCLNNLRNLGISFRIFAADHQDRFPMQVSTNEGGSMEFMKDESPLHHFIALSNELSTPTIIACPGDKRRSPATNFLQIHNENVGYFVRLESQNGETNTMLSGDSNLTINQVAVKPGTVVLNTNSLVGWTAARHKTHGNLLMSDGRVSLLAGPSLAALLRQSGVATNTLALP